MSLVDNQTPQLKAVDKAEMHQGFLGKAMRPVEYQVSFANGDWWINAGLVQN
ncbi:MAG: hypothetical protein R3E95_17935 [Thiolinea sp.]